MFKVLILEDDLLLAQTLQEELEEEGYFVTLAHTIVQANDLTFDAKFKLYLFDVNVPDGSGFELLKELRESDDDTPTIFLTSKAHAKDVGEGFDVGANDYVKKPFEMEELLYRIKRFLKEESLIQISDTIKFNPQNYEIFTSEGTFILQKKESEILHYFLKSPNKIISKDEIINNIFDGNYFSDATFRVYITHIKKIIGSKRLTNRRGSGYIFEKL